MADTFGWRVTFALVSVLTAVLMALMAVSLPRNSHPAKIGFLRQFRLFFDRRIQLGVADVVFGAAASYVFYTYLSPIMRDEIGVIGQNVCPFWLVFLCGSGRFSCSSCMGGELEVGQNVCPEWPVRPCGTTVE